MNQQIWLTAYYHFPSVFSCRVPMSSISSAKTLPSPGPATIRLALIRTGIELFGLDHIRDELFPIIRSMNVKIIPPEQVAISTQTLKHYKGSADERVVDSIGYREFAHARGNLQVCLQISTAYVDVFKEILRGIGYWGQTSSLTCCVRVEHKEPDKSLCAVPLWKISPDVRTQSYFVEVATEFKRQDLTWEEIAGNTENMLSFLDVEIFLWPLYICERDGKGTLLVRRSL